MDSTVKIETDEQWKNVPVLLITTESCVETVLDAANKGAAGYVKKPFTAGDIQAKIEPLLAGVPA